MWPVCLFGDRLRVANAKLPRRCKVTDDRDAIEIQDDQVEAGEAEKLRIIYQLEGDEAQEMHITDSPKVDKVKKKG